MPTVLHAGRTLTLDAADFVAQGGQASVFARGSTAFKVFTDPTAVPPVAKLDALRALAAPGLVTPEEDLVAPDGTRLGYTMRFLDGWGPLCRLFPPAYRQRNHLDAAAMAHLVLSLRAHVAHAHARNALVVDLNEMNGLVDPSHREVALIDLDSWQLAGFPATALAETVRDRHSGGFDNGTDWFAFAIVTFQMFTGMHPFRGHHPTVKSLDDRMQADLSVFHPTVTVPPMVHFDGLPPTWRDWYEALFVHRERIGPPTTLDARAIRRPQALPGASVEVQTLFELPGAILGTASWDGRVWAWTRHGLFEGRRRIGPSPDPKAVPFRSPDGIAMAVLDQGALVVRLADGTAVPTDWRVDDLAAHEGLLHARAGSTLLELQLKAILGNTTLLARPAMQIAPAATDLFRGIVVSRALDSNWLTLLGPGTTEQHRFEDLDGQRIVDATATSGIAVVVTRGTSGWTRHLVCRDGIRSAPTSVPSAELVVLPTGIALVPTETGIEIFALRDPLGAARTVNTALPALLQAIGGRPGFVVDRTVHTLQLRR